MLGIVSKISRQFKRPAHVETYLLTTATSMEEKVAVHADGPSKEHVYGAQLLAYAAPSLMLHVITDEQREIRATSRVMENRIAIADTGNWVKLVDDYVTSRDAHTRIAHATRNAAYFTAVIRDTDTRYFDALQTFRRKTAMVAKQQFLGIPYVTRHWTS